MRALIDKLGQTLRFLRFGPTQLHEARDRVQGLEARAHALESSLSATQAGLLDLQGQIKALQQSDKDLWHDAGWVRDQLSALAAALDRAQSSGPTDSAGSSSAGAAEEAFYPALERHFRGSPEDVRQRLAAYREWMTGLPTGPVGDIGCGRGEWLELLGEWNLPARGVDLNALNVQDLRARGLQVDQGDALQWLQAQPTGSFAALTAFHVVEHLPFGVLLRLVQEAWRVLQPGGLLILETPNPENLDVASHTFWLDPSHQRPVPAALLELVVRHAGLQVQACLRLHPPPGDGLHIGDATLRAMLMQGRDVAVVARKPPVPTA